MAENKKSFVAYSDWYGIFKALPDDVAGKLIKHIFSYVNDENPITDDYVINALFEPIKNALKRDLVKWENERQQRSDAGKKSAELRSQRNSTSVETRSTKSNETERNSTDNVNVNVNVINNKIESRKLKFANTLKPFLETYGKEMIRKFYDYWTEPNKSNTKFKMELEKTWSLERRLETWATREKDFTKDKLQPINNYPKLK
jgi:hypothetical protein